MRLRARPWTLAFAFGAASTVALGMSSTLLVLKHGDGSLTTGLTCFMSPFVLAGLFLAYLAAREVYRAVRYGSWEIEVPDTGGVVGQPLPVRIFPARAITPTGDVKVTLRCQRSSTSRSGAGRRTSTTTQTNTLGQVETSLPTGPLDPRSSLPVAVTLDVPTGLPPSSDGDMSVTWQVTIEVPAADGGVHATFDVPVRETR